ncbi:MAG: HPF/RaiA family ribosome-associated protein [Nitrospiraceae bacterium]|nr:MAG: HPF/RaiA family ribosome-associated protein [Nitrospiraceae bacterium]
MENPLQITGRNFELTDAIKSEIHKRAEKLDKFYNRIMSCRVVIESPQRHRHAGKLYSVNIDITVPGGELCIRREPREDLYVSIRDNFQAARRKLEDFARRQRREVKHHEEKPQAHISSLFPEKGYGFITTPENREIYFHKNSVVNSDFKNLKVGMSVHYVEEKGQKGPQASTVSID